MVEFRCEILRATERPQFLVWQAAHGDYSENFIFDEGQNFTEEEAGHRVLNMLFKSKHRPHLGPLEHPHITLAVGNFPHDTVMQMRTHRMTTFDVQSMRYTGQRIIDYVDGKRNFEEVFYLPPVGTKMTDREGHKIIYDEDLRSMDRQAMYQTAVHYSELINVGVPPEHARRVLSSGYRQNFTFTVNARTMMHLLDMRGAKDVQDECAHLAAMMLERFEEWMPEVAAYYRQNRWTKSNLAP